MAVQRRRAVVRGRVQGVFFRDSCQHEAQRLGVTGWVRNTSDGSVEVVAQGEPEAVQRLLEWCRQGPPEAEVTDVQVHDEHPDEGEREFTVR